MARQHGRLLGLQPGELQEVLEPGAIGRHGFRGRLLFDPQVVAELLKKCGQAHESPPPSVRHALWRIIRRYEPCVKCAFSHWTGTPVQICDSVRPASTRSSTLSLTMRRRLVGPPLGSLAVGDLDGAASSDSNGALRLDWRIGSGLSAAWGAIDAWGRAIARPRSSCPPAPSSRGCGPASGPR